jgi:hypothetical protein
LGRRRAASFFTGPIPTPVPGAAKAKTGITPSDNRGSERVLARHGDPDGVGAAGSEDQIRYHPDRPDRRTRLAPGGSGWPSSRSSRAS